ncbi:hypothetical protein acsn021_30660 [Anaerocolumna cellulosilytica]|uniref:Uncharacterized protein n=2 Tax=Anaerocolumna cellulosilytica TaxID=433286 RepID=A0A6S6R5X5_9FIRM|nr:hypothetical protein acsn021_30660 [Anaerocolumna cellulosilytica]
MGDDCFSHAEEKEYDKSVTIAYVLEEITHYVPSMYNVVWTISSPDDLVGFIITDNQGNAEIELNIQNKEIVKLFSSETGVELHCRYYHQSSFSWTDGKTGEYIEKYKECGTLIDKVKMHCLDF